LFVHIVVVEKNKITPFFEEFIRQVKVKMYICRPFGKTGFFERVFVKYRLSTK
jgi:hypothetical protein